ncbi:MAG: SAM-dependent methyltransferase [Lachnospiraceae bacterium]|nr:SAM-dependent methyltransferase [Lachnospiraceae bacterium]
MKLVQLSKRLLAAAGMVTKGNIVADIGCDHAYTSIYLCRAGIAPKVIAMDVNKGPLVGARAHVEEAGLASQIDIRLSDGLQKLVPGEADTVLLCGMGGLLMIKILSDFPEATASLKELVLQPQSEVGEVRMFLHKQGYEITKEHMLKEDGKFYVMMRAVKCTAPQVYETECDYLYGKLLIEEKNEVLLEYLEREQRLRTDVLAALSGLDTENARLRKESLNREFSLIEEARTRIMRKVDA